jgi:hypothetical protein
MNLKSPSKSFYLLLLLLALGFFCARNWYEKRLDIINQERADQESKLGQLEAHVKDMEANGTGYFLSQLKKMKKEDLDRATTAVEGADQNAFIAAADVADSSLKLEATIRADLDQLPGVSSGDIWEGLKEINSIHDEEEGISNSIQDVYQTSSNMSSLGRHQGLTPQQNEELDKETAEEYSDEQKQAEELEEDGKDLPDDEFKIAALVLSRVPVSRRESVLEILKKNIQILNP